MLSNSRTLLFFRILALSTSAIKSSALSINVTVDDQLGDEVTGAMPTYSPLSIWNRGANCSRCKARPDPSLAFDNTWHDTTAEPGDSFPTVEISFTGTAVYAFFILGNNIPGAPASLTNLAFNLDGNDAGTFLHNPTSGSDFIFNALGFSQESLENNQHTLIISDVGTPSASLILFDFLIYTVEEEDVTITQTFTNPSNAHTTTSTITSLVTSPVGTTSTKPSSTPISELTSTSEQSSIEPGSNESNTPNEPLATPPSTVLETVLQTHPQTETTRSPPVTSLTNTPSAITNILPGPVGSQFAPRKATRNVGAIVGGLLGATAAVILTILVFLCYRRRRREREASWIARQFVVSSRHSLAPTIVQVAPQTRESRNIDFPSLTPERTNTLSSLRPTLGSNVGQPQRIEEQFGISPRRVGPSPLNGADRGRREDSLGMTDTAMHFDNEKSDGSNGDLQSSTGTDDVRTALLDRFPGHRETRLESTPSADRNDVVLLNQIATLQAEVDRLQSFRQSVVDSGILISTSGANQSDEPPPGYYGERDEASVPRQL